MPTPSCDNAPSISHFRGCLLGGALGDALGYPIEFDGSSVAILAEHGATAPVDMIGRQGGLALVSDDTQMTMFVAEGWIRGLRGAPDGRAGMLANLQRALVRWYGTQTKLPPPHGGTTNPGWLSQDQRLHARRAPGNTCMSALARQVSLPPGPTVATPPNDSKGCGAVMRSAPIGLAASSREEAFFLARDAGVLTHGHPSGYLSAAYFASLVHDVSRGTTLPQAMDLADALLATSPGRDEMERILRGVREAAKGGPPSATTLERLGGGWTGEEALGIALVCALTATSASPASFADAVWRSVAHGGDSDSTGSLTGNLLGAMHGEEGLPPRWLAQVELRDALERLADDLYAAAILGDVPDGARYPV